MPTRLKRNESSDNTTELRYIDQLSKVIRLNLIATHIFAAFGFVFTTFAVFTVFYGISIANFKGTFFAVLLHTGTAALFFGYASIRARAKVKALKFVSVVLITIALLYLSIVLIFCASFLTYRYPEYPLHFVRFSTVVFITIYAAYISYFYVKGQTSVWSKAYKKFSRLVQGSESKVGPLYGILPKYSQSTSKYKLILAMLTSSISGVLLASAITIITTYPLVHISTYLSNYDKKDYFEYGSSYQIGKTLAFPIFIILMPLVFILISSLLRNFSHVVLKPNIRHLINHDHRNPVLYLRSFSNDKDKLNKSFVYFEHLLSQTHFLNRIDEFITERLWHLGPVIALSNPVKNSTSLAGPVLQKQSENNWKLEVANKMREAECIVLKLGVSDSLQWEINECIKPQNIKKCIFIVGPRRQNKSYSGIDLLCSQTDLNISSHDRRNALLIVRKKHSWLVVCSNRRNIFDYDAALLVGMSKPDKYQPV